MLNAHSLPLRHLFSKNTVLLCTAQMSTLSSKVLAYRTVWSPVELIDKQIHLPVQPTELVVKVTHMALNPVDLKLRAVAFLPIEHYIGFDFCGTVEVAGSAVADKFAVGERICGKKDNQARTFVGSRALVNATSSSIFKPPTSVSDAEAAAFPLVFGTAWGMLDRATLDTDSSILVLGGATSVGTFVIQLASKREHIRNIVAVCSGSSSDYVKSFGATHVIDYTKGNISEQLVQYAKQHGKFQAIFDCVGGYEALSVYPQILNPVADKSVYVTIVGDGNPGKTNAGTVLSIVRNFPRVAFRLTFGRFLGINYHLLVHMSNAWTPFATELINNLKLRIPIDTVYPIEDYKTAIERLDKAQARGKVVLQFS